MIVELWLVLFDLFPTPFIPNATSRPSSVRFDSGPADINAMVRSLLAPDLPDPKREHHEFIMQAHRPRVFKAWVGELSDICRDYFWYAHSHNA